MKASKLIVLLGLMVLPVFAFGQTKSIDVMETVKVNREVSTHFVTGDPIKYVDISMNEVVGNLPLKNILRIKPIEEKIKVKNNRGGWGEEDRTFIDGQSMGIVTIVTERSVSQYQLVYTEIPQDACSQYVIPLSEKSSYLNPDVSMSETEMVKFCWTVWNSKANYHDVRTKKDKMLFKLNNIYTLTIISSWTSNWSTRPRLNMTSTRYASRLRTRNRTSELPLSQWRSSRS